MPSVIDRAVRTLTGRGVPHHVNDEEVVVPPPTSGGFEVRLRMVSDRAYVVCCGGWRHAFDRAEDAYDCFEYGLSDSCRLKVVFRGERPEVWQLEKREFGMWTPAVHVTRRRSWAFWRPRRVEYRQNQVFSDLANLTKPDKPDRT